MNPTEEDLLLRRIAVAGFNINAVLREAIAKTTRDVVQAAIKAAENYIQNLKNNGTPLKKRPEAILMKAIQQQWTPNDSDEALVVIPPDFDEWHELALKLQIVTGPRSGTQAITGHPQGELCVFDGRKWEPYFGMKMVFSIAYMRQMWEETQQAIARDQARRQAQNRSCLSPQPAT